MPEWAMAADHSPAVSCAVWRLLHDGDLWLLDEPTKGLDVSTEQQILTLLR